MIINYPKEVEEIINRLEVCGFRGYIVGGCIRDTLLGKIPYDWDITTDAKPDDITKIFNNYKVILTGVKHGTVSVIINNNQYEITTFRIEEEYIDNRRPKNVKFTKKIVDDLSRRDFTVNAIAYNYKENLVDPFNGRKDINNKIIKTVGNPFLRFSEDALRILRGVRFAVQHNFKIDEETNLAIRKLGYLLENISVERIRDEFNKILLSEKPSKGIYLLIDLGLIDYILPELNFQNISKYNKDYDEIVVDKIFSHYMNVLDKVKPDLDLRLTVLLLFVECSNNDFTIMNKEIDGECNRKYEISESILRRLKYDNKTIKVVGILIKEINFKALNNNLKSIKKFIVKVGKQNLRKLFELRISDEKVLINSNESSKLNELNLLIKKCEEIIRENHPLVISDLNINGNDLIDLGIQPGKNIGNILNELLELVLEEPELNKRNKLIDKAIKYLDN